MCDVSEFDGCRAFDFGRSKRVPALPPASSAENFVGSNGTMGPSASQ
jgi:hypothetical protein